MHSSRMHTVCCSGHWGVCQHALDRGCIPACTGQGVYPSMHWAGGVCIPACTGQVGSVCLGGELPRGVGSRHPSWDQRQTPPSLWTDTCEIITSGMRTTRLLTVSQHALGRGVYPSMHRAGDVYPRGCLPRGVCGRHLLWTE